MKKIKNRIAAILFASVCSLVPFSMRTANYYVANADKDWNTGIIDGYFYDSFNQSGAGEYTFENSEDNGLHFEWGKCEFTYASKGKKFEDKPSAYNFNKFDIEYDADIRFEGCDNIGILGYMGRNGEAKIEFYIVEGWGSWRPSGDAEIIGTLESNGVTYDIVRTKRIGPISDFGAPPYEPEQYWSIRQDGQMTLGEETNLSNNINLIDHFKAWHNAGMMLDGVIQVAFNIEGFNSSGEANVKKLNMTSDVGDSPAEWIETVEKETNYAVPDEKGVYYRFDSTEHSEYVRRYPEIPLVDVEDKFASDGKATFVESGDPQYMNYAVIEVPPKTIKRGGTYSVGMYVKQDAEETANVKLYLNTCSYRGMMTTITQDIGTAELKKGEWSKIEITDLQISNEYLYDEYLLCLETELPIDFYFDDLEIAEKGYQKKSPISFTPPQKKGDLNRDGSVDVFDIILCRKALTDMLTGEEIRYYADINEDGELSVSDLVMLNNFVSGNSYTKNEETDTKENT